MADELQPQSVEMSRIFLDKENPRHEPYDDEAAVIEYLCRYENVLPLAKDIVKNGMNPLELLAVIPDANSGGGKMRKPTYVVAEGNRRLCALKLLDDPERAPAKLRKSFEELSAEWEGIATLACIVFADRDAVRMWLGRLHEGEQGGIGRRKWNADQTARHSGDSKNQLALALLDYAEAEGLVTSEGRKGKLTTATRYLSSSLVREAMGLDGSKIDDIRRNRAKPDFNKLLQKFIDDLSSGHVHSRANRDQHAAYARELAAVELQNQERITPVSLNNPKGPAAKPSGTPKRPIKRKPRRFIPYEEEIMEALEALGGDKLPNLYSSICSVSLDSHTPLVSIGVWAFIESLASRAGRTTDTDFPSFFSTARLQSYGLPTGKGGKAIRDALKRVSTSGDVTKHDKSAALFHGEQLINDMETLRDLIVKCAEAADAKKA